MKPYYDEDGITIYHGDCRDVLPVSPKVDLFLADPPYNCGLEYGLHDDNMPWSEYEEWCRDWWTAGRVSAYRMIVFPGVGNLMRWERIAHPSAVGCWDKIGATPSSSTLGFVGWEPYLYWTGDKGLLGGTDVVRCRAETNGGAHPCPKPIGLMRALIRKTRAESVIDPFVGSGTTLVAAKLEGRNAIGIEIEEKYCEIAAKRLAQGVLPFQ